MSATIDWDKLKWRKTEEVEPPTHTRLIVRSGACSAVREVRSLRSVSGVWFRVWWNPFENAPEPGVSQWMEWARQQEEWPRLPENPPPARRTSGPRPGGPMLSKYAKTYGAKFVPPQNRRKFQVKVGSGTSKTVWVKGAVTEGATVDFKIVGDPKWRRGVAYDVTWVPSSPFKLTMGGAAPK